MLSKKYFTLILFFVLVVMISFYFLSERSENDIKIIIEKEEYQKGENPRLKISNDLFENICFSSCYPYYLERKIEKEEWERRSYGNCEEEDIAIKCISFKNLRAFELMLKNPERGVYRVSVPICINCREGEIFQEDKEIFSPFFEVK